ncbi:hypothetical protein Tco_0133918 [Tanacetum coccineum]
MANAEQAPARASPVRTDEQIVPRNQWVPIGKSNCYLNEEKSQRNPIFKIAVDILKQTNFFRAFTASSTIPAIYIQQFWDTIRFDSKARSYRCQLDEQWFNLNQDTLRDALQITPVDNNRAFSSPPTPDTLVEFVNELGYPKEVVHLSNVTTNDMFQPWRALATIINLCLTGKTSGFERPRAPALQILWGIVNRAHIDYAERMWEEFTQSIHTFTEDKKKLAQHTLGKKKATLILIPSIRFTKLIIFHLQRLHNFHPRPESPLHLPTEEPVLGHLKFSAKGSKREVFGMTIPNDLINDVIRGADYYDAYLEKLNLTKPRWEATGFEFKHDYTVIDSPRAVTFRDKYGVQMIMRFNEIHKFSDGTLQQIDEALDYRVKEFQINRSNPGMNTRFWSKKDVDRSKDFIFAIQKRLKIRRIFRNLESFVGGRIREGDYRLLKRTE